MNLVHIFMCITNYYFVAFVVLLFRATTEQQKIIEQKQL